MRYAFLFFAFFIGQGSYFTALSPYVHTNFGSDSWKVFLAGQITFPLGYFLSGYLSDRLHRIRGLLVPALLLHAPLQFMLFNYPEDLGATILLSGAVRFLFAVNIQLISIAVLEGAGTERFGRIRSAGTVSFLLLHLVLFLSVSDWGRLLDSMGLSFRPEDAGAAGRYGSFFHLVTSLVALGTPAARFSSTAYYFRDAAGILRRPAVIRFLLLSFIFFFSFQLIDYYVGQYLKDRGGLTLLYAGWCLAVLLEIPFLLFAARTARRGGVKSLFLIAAGAGTIRFAWLSLDILGAAPVPIVYSQLLHGIQFTGYYMGAIYWLKRTFPDHLFGTGNGIYMVLCSAMGGMIGNLVYGRLLYSGVAARFSIGADEATAGFFPVFFSAMFLQGFVFFCFIFSRSLVSKDP